MANDNMIPNLRAVKNEADAAAVRAAPAVADEAALAGKPAGQYELSNTAELVAWNGATVTARGPMPVSPAKLRAALDTAPRISATLVGVHTTDANITPSLHDALNVKKRAVDLPAGEHRMTSPLALNSSPLRGVKWGDTVIWSKQAGGNSAITIISDPPEIPYDTPQDEMLAGVELRGAYDAQTKALFIPPEDSAEYADGVVHQGTRNSTSSVRVRGFVNGYTIQGSHTYLNIIKNLQVMNCYWGLTFGNQSGSGATNYGENVVVQGGAVTDNWHNVRVRSGAWFVALNDVSFDYPVATQFWLEDKLSCLRVVRGNVEWRRTREQGNCWLVNGDNLADGGIMRFEGCGIGVFERPGKPGDTIETNSKRFNLRTADELVGPGIGAITLVFRDCTDIVFGETVNRVITKGRGQPGVDTIKQMGWMKNTSLVRMRVRLMGRFTGTATARRMVEISRSKSDGSDPQSLNKTTCPANQPGDEFLIVFDVGADEQWKYAAAGDVAIEAVGYDLLP